MRKVIPRNSTAWKKGNGPKSILLGVLPIKFAPMCSNTHLVAALMTPIQSSSRPFVPYRDTQQQAHCLAQAAAWQGRLQDDFCEAGISNSSVWLYYVVLRPGIRPDCEPVFLASVRGQAIMESCMNPEQGFSHQTVLRSFEEHGGKSIYFHAWWSSQRVRASLNDPLHGFWDARRPPSSAPNRPWAVGMAKALRGEAKAKPRRGCAVPLGSGTSSG